MKRFFEKRPRFLRRTITGCLVSVPLMAFAIIDRDNDGMSDLWEDTYGFAIDDDGTLIASQHPDADPDGDGWSNAKEAIAGTDPLSGAAPAGFLQPVVTRNPLAPSVFLVSWPTVKGKYYKLFVSADLTVGSWTQLDEPMTGDGTEIQIAIEPELEDETTPPRLFWRVSVSDPDSDADGWSDAEETVLETNPLGSATTTDSDQDGIMDASDAIPGDAAISWPSSGTSSYSVIELPSLPEGYRAIKLGDGLHVVARTDYANYMPGGKMYADDAVPHVMNIDDETSFNVWTKILLPGGTTWLDLPQSSGSQAQTHFYGIATGVAENGDVVGWSTIGREATAPGMYAGTARWKLEAGAYQPAEKLWSAGPAYNGDRRVDFWARIEHENTNIPLVNGNGQVIGHPWSAAGVGTVNPTFYPITGSSSQLTLHVEAGAAATDWATGTYLLSPGGDILWEGEVAGVKKSRIKLAGNTSETIGSPLTYTTALGRVLGRVSTIQPIPDTVAVLGSGLRTKKTTPGATWLTPKSFVSGQAISEDGTVLSILGDKLWKDGKWIPITSLLNPSQWTNIQAIDLNSHSVILISADKVGAGPSGVGKLLILQPSDLDIIHPATGELSEAREDLGDGGYVSVKREPDGQDVTPVTEMKIRRMRGFDSNAKFRLKFDKADRYELYQDLDRTIPVVSESTEFDVLYDTAIYCQGVKKSLSRGGELVTVQVKINGAWQDGDTVKFTVVQSEFLIQVKAFIPYGWSEAEEIPGDTLHLFNWLANPMDGKVVKGDFHLLGPGKRPAYPSFRNAYSDDNDDARTGGLYNEAPFRICQTVILTPYGDLHPYEDISSNRKVFTAPLSEHFTKSTAVDSTEIALKKGYKPLSGVDVGHGKPEYQTDLFENPSRASGTTEITIEAAGKDGALGIVTPVAADIHWRLFVKVWTLDPLQPVIEYGGVHDSYPAYEIISIQSDESYVDVHRYSPPPNYLPGAISLSAAMQQTVAGFSIPLK